MIRIVLHAADLVDDGCQESKCDECSWRQHEHQRSEVLREDCEVEDLSCAEELSASAEQCQRKCESESDADAVEDGL